MLPSRADSPLSGEADLQDAEPKETTTPISTSPVTPPKSSEEEGVAKEERKECSGENCVKEASGEEGSEGDEAPKEPVLLVKPEHGENTEIVVAEKPEEETSDELIDHSPSAPPLPPIPAVKAPEEKEEVKEEQGGQVLLEGITSASATTEDVQEVHTLLSTLEGARTPDSMSDSIVRASFVDFVMDDPIEGGTDDDDGDDEDEEDNNPVDLSDTNPNPELQRIREEQVRKWLIFEQENPVRNGQSEQSGREELSNIVGLPPSLLSSLDADSLVTDGSGLPSVGPDGENELMMNGVDGMQRRVRFLTDKEGNLLISVFMTKLVTLFLIILKVASAGYLDYLSLSAPPPPSPCAPDEHPSHSSPPSLHPSSCKGHIDETEEASLHHFSSSASTTSSADSFMLLLEPPETQTDEVVFPPPANSFCDKHLSFETSPCDLVLLIPDRNCSTPGAPPQGDETALADTSSDTNGADTTPENPEVVVSPPSLTEVETVEEQQIEEANTGGQEIISSIEGSNKDSSIGGDQDEANSSDETLSVSSCNSMIEIMPPSAADVSSTLESNVVNQGNKDPFPSVEADKSMSSVSTCLAQLEPPPNDPTGTPLEEDEEEEGSCNNSTSSQPSSLIVHELEEEHVEQGLETSGKAPPAIIQLPNIDENNNVVEDEAKFVPLTITSNIVPPSREPGMPELRRSFSDGEEERLTPTSGSSATDDIPRRSDLRRSPKKMGDLGWEDQNEQPMISLCIQEEHISSVALTIAKWESMSKAQSTENLATSTPPLLGNIIGSHAPVSKTCSTPCSTTTPKPPKAAAPPPKSAAGTLLTHTIPPPAPLGGNTNDNQSNNRNHHRSSNERIVVVNNSMNTSEPLIMGKAAGWNCWGSKVKEGGTRHDHQNNGNSPPVDDEIIYAQPNNQAGTTMTSIANPSAILKAYPKPLSKGEIINWLREGEIHRAGILLNYGQGHHHTSVVVSPNNNTSPVLVSWFFGLISRQQAEKYLHGQPPGTFLVRISTRIWGYTLSYQASSQRTKHFLISAVNPAVPATLPDTNGNCAAMPPQTGRQQRMSPFVPQGRYAFIGTNMTPYGTLVSLIRHHSHAPITKLGGEKLLNPCPGGPQVPGLELLFK